MTCIIKFYLSDFIYLKYSSELCELPYHLGILQSFRSPNAGAPVATYTAFGGYM